MATYGKYYDSDLLNLLKLNPNIKYKKMIIIKEIIKNIYFNGSNMIKNNFFYNKLNILIVKKKRNIHINLPNMLVDIDLSGNFVDMSNNNLFFNDNDINILFFMDKKKEIYSVIKQISNLFITNILNEFSYKNKGKNIKKVLI